MEWSLPLPVGDGWDGDWTSLSLFGLSILVNVGYLAYYDFQPRVLGDAAGSVTKCSTVGNPLEWLFVHHQLMNVGFLVPFCAIVTVFGVMAWIGVQILLVATATVLVYRTGTELLNEWHGFLAGLLFALVWETFRFTRRPQSDLIFVFAIALAIWALTRYQTTKTRRWRLVVLAALALVATSRPFGLPVVGGWLLWDLLDDDRRLNVFPSRRVNLIVLVAIVVYLSTTKFVSPDLTLRTTAETNLWNRWSQGVIVTHTSEPTVHYQFASRGGETMIGALLLNADHMLLMALLRVAWFFVPVLPRWSTLHVVLNLTTLFPVILGMFGGLAILARDRRRDLLQILATPLLMLLVPVMVAYLDGGFNYRAPAVPIFALLTAYFVSESELLEPMRRWGLLSK